MFTKASLEFGELVSEFPMRFQRFAQLHKGAHDRDVYLHSARAGNECAFGGHRQAKSRVIWTTVLLKMLSRNCGAMPTANMRSVTGTTTNFSRRPRSERVAQ